MIGRQWVIEQRGLYDTFLGNGQRLGGRANLRSNRYPMTGISTNTGIVRKRGKGVKLGSLHPEGISSIDRGNSPRELAALQPKGDIEMIAGAERRRITKIK